MMRIVIGIFNEDRCTITRRLLQQSSYRHMKNQQRAIDPVEDFEMQSNLVDSQQILNRECREKNREDTPLPCTMGLKNHIALTVHSYPKAPGRNLTTSTELIFLLLSQI